MPPARRRSYDPLPPTEQRRILAGVDVRQLAGRGIEHGDEERDESRCGGACLHDLRVEPRHEVGALEAFVHERAHHREQQRHQQRGGAALAGDVAERQQHASVGQRKDVVEIAADRVGGPRHPERFDARRLERRARQHRLLDLAGDLEIVLERQPVGDFEQHEQVDQQEAREQPQRAGRERRMRNQQEVRPRETAPSADEAGDERDAVDQPPRRRQLAA